MDGWASTIRSRMTYRGRYKKMCMIENPDGKNYLKIA